MRSKFSIIIFIAIFAALFSTCSKTNYPEQIAQIDSLQVRLNDAEAMLNKVDTIKVATYHDTLQSHLKQLENLYTIKKDTLNKDVALFLSDYRSIRKPLKIFKGEHKKLREEIKFTRKQLENLKHDFEKNITEKNKVLEFLAAETTATNSLIDAVTRITTNASQQVVRFEEFNPKIEAHITQLETEIASKNNK